jgi:hypothetical protein
MGPASARGGNHARRGFRPPCAARAVGDQARLGRWEANGLPAGRRCSQGVEGSWGRTLVGKNRKKMLIGGSL